MIDLCPVGALTAKPSRYKARAWELVQHESIAPHDSLGSNIYIHSRRGEIVRVVPRDNENINEVWISDRDRFAYEGLEHPDRLTVPMIKEQGKWREVDWDTALKQTAEMLRRTIKRFGAEEYGVLVSPRTTLEEKYLLQKLMRGLGVSNIDHRLRQWDFAAQQDEPQLPAMDMAVKNIDQLGALLVIGSDVRKDVPLVGHRVRKAAMNGCAVTFINPIDFDFRFPVAAKLIDRPSAMVDHLAAVAKACAPDKVDQSSGTIRAMLENAEVSETHEFIAEQLRSGDSSAVLLGQHAITHPDYSALLMLAAFIKNVTESKMGILHEACDSVGGWLAGTLPHRAAGGEVIESPGQNAREMIANRLRGYFLFDVEPDYDCADPSAAARAMRDAKNVIAVTSFKTSAMEEYANILLPLASFGETDGTYVNLEGVAQSFTAAVKPKGNAREGWKILRVLGNETELAYFDYLDAAEIADEVLKPVEQMRTDVQGTLAEPFALAPDSESVERITGIGVYSGDALVRRASSLQATEDARVVARMNNATREKLELNTSDRVIITCGDTSVEMLLETCDAVPDHCIWIPGGTEASASFGDPDATLEIRTGQGV